MKLSRTVLLLLLWLAAPLRAEEPCNVAPDPALPQYIIGYGSLMEEASRLKTTPQAGEALPVSVTGFRRGWIAQGSAVGFSTTFLGVTSEPAARMNAVLYSVPGETAVATLDRRESGYCRVAVAAKQITPLSGQLSATAQIWLYASPADKAHAPSRRFPIVQSYVDVFLSGCLQVEQRYQLDGFARECVQTTQGWSKHWVNDRIYPRRPFVYQPNAGRIDELLSEEVPKAFAAIRIE